MRIALVATGGVDRSARERVIPSLLWFIERLARRHTVVVYALRYHEFPCTYPLLGAMVRDLGRPQGAPAQYLALRRALAEDGPFDVVHAYWALPAGLAASAAARRLGIPSIVTLDSGELVRIDDIGYGLQRTWLQRLAVAATIRMATRVTVCSKYMGRLAAEAGFAATRIPIGVDTGCFPKAAVADGPPWRLVHVASLNPVKDQTTLLRSVQELVGGGRNVHLDIVGEDTCGGALQRLSKRLGLDNHVTFHGFKPTEGLADFFARAHVNVVSSRHEAAGVVVLEAAAAGVPTVGTAVGYVADWAPYRAVAVPRRDPVALARAIGALLDDPRRRREIAASAAAWTREHDADWTAERFETLYRELTAAASVPAPVSARGRRITPVP